jgi:phospholipid-binding lipoprotein MlaA
MKEQSVTGDLRHRVGRALAAVSVLVLAGCATVERPNPRDPLESFNRSMFSFNDELDKAVLKPVATIYREAVPQPVRTGISNFLGNLDDVWSFFNSLMQGKGQAAAQTFMRVNINTVFGLGGVLDIASEARLERRREDFGQTLAVWGFPSGPFVVLPFFGPSTMIDVVAMPVDFRGDLINRIEDIPVRNTLKVLDQLDLRASFLSLGQAIDEGALDKYTFTREAFLQRRRNAIYDGNPPDEPADSSGKAP